LRTILQGHDGPVLAISFSSAGHRLASASADTTTRLWDVSLGLDRILRGNQSYVLAAAFLPSQDILATVGVDKSLRLWPVDASLDVPRNAPDLASWLNRLTTRMLTEYEAW